MLARARSGPNGITDQAASDGMMASTGATRKSMGLTCVGSRISFSISLMPSAIGCSSPSGPVRFGPIRTCM